MRRMDIVQRYVSANQPSVMFCRLPRAHSDRLA